MPCTVFLAPLIIPKIMHWFAKTLVNISLQLYYKSEPRQFPSPSCTTNNISCCIKLPLSFFKWWCSIGKIMIFWQFALVNHSICIQLIRWLYIFFYIITIVFKSLELRRLVITLWLKMLMSKISSFPYLACFNRFWNVRSVFWHICSVNISMDKKLFYKVFSCISLSLWGISHMALLTTGINW